MAVTRKQIAFGALCTAVIALPFSIAICHIALILFLLLWITEGEWKEKLLVAKNNIIVQLILAFSILQLMGMFYTENISNGWFSLEKKTFFFLIPIALATSSVKFEKKEIHQLFYLFVGACFIGSLICIIHAVHQLVLFNEGALVLENINYLQSSRFREFNPTIFDQWLLFSYVELANGINIHPTYFSLYLSFCVVFLLHQIFNGQFENRKSKIIVRFVIFYFTVFIVSLASRIMVISLIVIFFLMLAEAVVSRKQKIDALVLLSCIALLCLTLYINPVSRYRNLQEIHSSSLSVQPNTVYKTSTEIRASLWWLAWKSLAHVNPVWGTGSGDVDDTMKQISSEYEVTNIIDSYNPHNQFLYTMLGNGIIGLIIFILLLIVPFYRAWINLDYLLLAFIFLFSVLCLTETALELQKGIAFFAVFFSILNLNNQAFQTATIHLRFFNAKN